MNKKNIKYQFLARLVTLIKESSLDLQVSQFINLQRLIHKFPNDEPIISLKEWLGPVVSKSEGGQTKYYSIFDRALLEIMVLNEVEEQVTKGKDFIKPEKNVKPYLNFRVLLTLAGLNVFGILLIIYIFSGPKQPNDNPLGDYLSQINVPIDTSISIILDTTKITSEVIPVERCFFLSEGYIDFQGKFGQCKILDERIGFQYKSGEQIGVDTIPLMIMGKFDRIQRIYFIVNVVSKTISKVNTATPDLDDNVEAVNRGVVEQIIQFFWIIDDFIVENALFIWILLVILAIGIPLYWFYRQRKYSVGIRSLENPPYFWKLEVPQAIEIDTPAYFKPFIISLKQRRLEDIKAIDLNATIDKTIQNLGLTEIKFKQTSSVPEYLILIDRQNQENHQVHLWDWLYHQIQNNEVFVRRFYFDGDIRKCSNESYPKGVSLFEIQNRHRDSTLLIFSSGYQFIRQKTGDFHNWTNFLLRWEERVIFTSVPINYWGLKENTLQKGFELFPASIESVANYIKGLDTLNDAFVKADWLQSFSLTSYMGIKVNSSSSLITTLKSTFNEKQIKWVATCAIYPKLQWELTLFLAHFIYENKKISLKDLEQLIRLEWFVKGKIPDEYRIVLLDWLEQEFPELLNMIRHSLKALFSQQVIPEESIAYQEFRIIIALNEYALTKSRGKKRRLKQELTAGTNAGLEMDYAVLKHLGDDSKSIDFIIPKPTGKYVLQKDWIGLRNKLFKGLYGIWRYFWPVFALLFAAFFIYIAGITKRTRFSSPTLVEANNKYKSSVGLLTHAYFYYTENPYPLSEEETIIYIGLKRDGGGYSASFEKEDLDPFFHTGAGFLVGGSPNLRGNIITNRSIVDPNWLNQISFIDKNTEQIVIGIDKAVKDMVNNEDGYLDFSYKTMDDEIRFFLGDADFGLLTPRNTSDIVEFTKSAGHLCVKLEEDYFQGSDLFLLRGLNIDESKHHFISVTEEIEYYPSSNLEELDEVLLIGFSEKIDIRNKFGEVNSFVTPESISGKLIKINDQRIDYNLDCLSGSSGSPVFNKEGKLIAINSIGIGSRNNCSGISATILQLLKK